MQSSVVKILHELDGILSRWGRWYLFGAQAVVVWGVPRLSADVDVTLDLDPEKVRDFVDEMRQAGFDLLVDDAGFLERTRVLPFAHRSTYMPLDVVLAGSGLEDEFLSRARRVEIAGVAIPVIDVEDLMIAKILAGRPKDIEDVRGLLRVRGAQIDIERIRRVLGMLEEALSQSDLVPVLESLLESPTD